MKRSIEDIETMTAPGQRARMIFVSHGELWYVTDDGFRFPVPVSSIPLGDRVLPVENAINLKPWIRRHLGSMIETKTVRSAIGDTLPKTKLS